MAGANFQYDETGSTFYYFLCSFLGLLLIPSTFWFWPSPKNNEDPETLRKQCNCDPCYVKRMRAAKSGPWTGLKKSATKAGIVAMWAALIYLSYQVSHIKTDHIEYDPYQELEIDRGASAAEIRKAYRKMSLIFHPDKPTGDEEKFKSLAKAYAALTNEESKKNYEEYGNPDGPQAMQFGIALPKWMVEGKSSYWVLGIYVFLFIILMPTVVGTWWYRSIKFSGDQVLIDTARLYRHFIHKTPNMILRRAIVILGASFEFFKEYNSEVVSRPSDNEEIPWLMRQLDWVGKGKEPHDQPLFFPYSQKARALIYAQLARLELPPLTLDKDRLFVLSKVNALLNELIQESTILIYHYKNGHIPQQPRLDTIENFMKLSAMLVQAIDVNKSPLLQLPNITEDNLRHFTSKKKNIRNIHQFLALSPVDRRSLLRGLSDEQYRDVLNVCCQMPLVTMECDSKVLDDEDSSITVGALITVTVHLKRVPLFAGEGADNSEESAAVRLALAERETSTQYTTTTGGGGVEEVGEGDGGGCRSGVDGEVIPAAPAALSKKVWKDQNQKKKKGASKKKKSNKAGAVAKKGVIVNANGTAGEPITGATAGEESPVTGTPGTPSRRRPRSTRYSEDDDSDNDDDIDRQSDEDSDVQEREGDVQEREGNKKKRDEAGDEGEESDEEDEKAWKEFDEESRKSSKLETKSKESFSVHCPYFPLSKQEYWWVYVANKKTHELMTVPTLVTNLRDEEDVEVKFPAPQKEGEYTVTMCVKSDSYLDMDLNQTIKFHVKKAKIIESHPQWDFSDEEKEKDSGDDSEKESEFEYDEDDD